MFVRRDLVELQRFLTSEKYQTLLIVQDKSVLGMDLVALLRIELLGTNHSYYRPQSNAYQKQMFKI